MEESLVNTEVHLVALARNNWKMAEESAVGRPMLLFDDFYVSVVCAYDRVCGPQNDRPLLIIIIIVII